MKYTIALNSNSQYLISQLQNIFYLKIWNKSPLEVTDSDFFFWDENSNDKTQFLYYLYNSIHFYFGFSNNLLFTDFLPMPFSMDYLKNKMDFWKNKKQKIELGFWYSLWEVMNENIFIANCKSNLLDLEWMILLNQIYFGNFNQNDYEQKLKQICCMFEKKYTIKNLENLKDMKLPHINFVGLILLVRSLNFFDFKIEITNNIFWCGTQLEWHWSYILFQKFCFCYPNFSCLKKEL